MLANKKRNLLNGNAIGSTALSVLEPKIMLSASSHNSRIELTRFSDRDVGELSVNNNSWGVEQFVSERKKGFNQASRDKLKVNVQAGTTFSKVGKDDIAGATFTITNDGLSTTDNRPLGFPAVYTGRVSARDFNQAWKFTGVKQSQLQSAKFRLGSNATSKSGDFNVSMDVWLGGDTNSPNEYLMVHAYNSRARTKADGTGTGVGQPAGKVVQRNVKIDGTTYNIWRGKNHQGKYVTSYVAKTSTNKVTGNLANFLKDARSRKYVSSSNDLNAVFGGSEVWSGADGLNIDFGIDIKRKPAQKKSNTNTKNTNSNNKSKSNNSKPKTSSSRGRRNR